MDWFHKAANRLTTASGLRHRKPSHERPIIRPDVLTYPEFYKRCLGDQPGWYRNSVRRDAHREATWFVSDCLSIRMHAETECVSCDMLWQAFMKLLPGCETASKQELRYSRIDAHARDHLELHIAWTHRPESTKEAAEPMLSWGKREAPSFKIEIFTSEDWTSSWAGLCPGSLISQPLSQEWLRVIRLWMSACATKHKRCAAPARSSLPRRVIQVQSHAGECRLCLVETSIPFILSGQYVALSHCWGSRQPLKTTSKVLEQHRQQIPWDDPPKTYQDAVLVCMALGFQYLWIDSLCIVQDDSEDWAREVANMGAIYAHASIVIAATAAFDCTSGLFRPVPAQVELCIDSKSPDIPDKVYARMVVNHPNLSSRTPRKVRGDCHPELPLPQRAWYFQERLLASRILHFTRDEMIWECASDITCECSYMWRGSGMNVYRKGLKSQHNAMIQSHSPAYDMAKQPNHVQTDKRVMAVAPLFSRKPTNTRSPDTGHVWDVKKLATHWHRLVVQYVAEDMSFSSDRLPAMASVARQFLRTGQLGEYLAGLWSQDLPGSLVWSRGSPPEKCSSLLVHVPTWSWASVEGSWNYNGIYDLYNPVVLATTRKAHHTGTHLDQTTTTSGIKISVSGLLTHVTLFHNGDKLFPHGCRFHVGKHMSGYSMVQGEESGESCVGKAFWDFLLDEGPRKIQSDDTINLLQIMKDNYNGSRFLVLRQSVAQQQSGEYERVGVFVSPSTTWLENAKKTTVNLV
ncbi:hypothetical protein H2203_005186 [Taxawa tesnikishii (nom. ined.)]|nr:hypothetical protein H2203_005186 [Dothideales sp. JES 119]